MYVYVYVYMCMCVCVCVCVCVRVCARVCVRPFTVKASSLWISSTAREQIIGVEDVYFLCLSLHRYFRMKHLAFLTSHFILFTHWKRADSRIH